MIKVWIELYSIRDEKTENGGFETAMYTLCEELKSLGNEVRFYSKADICSFEQLENAIISESVDMVLPIFEYEYYDYRELYYYTELAARVVRIWHDVSSICPKVGCHRICGEPDFCIFKGDAFTPCRHFERSRYQFSLPVHNIFLCPYHWIPLFKSYDIIPWAVGYLPQCDLRDKNGEVIVLVGKTSNSNIRMLVESLIEAGERVRIIFSQWNRNSKEFKKIYRGEWDAYTTIIPAYNIRTDYLTVFSGAACLVLLTDFYETYNFLGHEAQRTGIPVISYTQSGGLDEASSAQFLDLNQVIQALKSGAHRKIQPKQIEQANWADIALKYANIGERNRLAHSGFKGGPI